ETLRSAHHCCLRTCRRWSVQTARRDRVRGSPMLRAESGRIRSSVAAGESFRDTANSDRETCTRQSLAFSYGANDRVFNDVQRCVKGFTCMCGCHRSAETNLVLRHDGVIDGRDEQAASPHFEAQFVEEPAIFADHDRYDEAV